MNLHEHIHATLLALPALETKRLVFKRIAPVDAAAVFKKRAEDGAGHFLGIVSQVPGGDDRVLPQKTVDAFKAETAIAWLANLKGAETETVIGTAGFSNINFETGRAELSGEMSKASWGKYYAIEGTLALISFGLNKLKLASIDAIVPPENTSAIYLLEKLGFQEESGANAPLLLFSRKSSV